MNGFLIIDKPKGWTSHDVVAKLRALTGVRKIGHAGTLDPMATGVLVVGIGKATKGLERFMRMDKEYEAEITFGMVSDTDDTDGAIEHISCKEHAEKHAYYCNFQSSAANTSRLLDVSSPDTPSEWGFARRSTKFLLCKKFFARRPPLHRASLKLDSVALRNAKLATASPVQYFRSKFESFVTKPRFSACSELIDLEDIQSVLNQFIGEINQIPPQFSAIKVNGKRAYKAARKGEKVKLKPRKVRIDSIEIQDYEWPTMNICVTCSKGTYIRALIRDIGKELGCGAVMSGLKRIRVGDATLDLALKDFPLDGNILDKYLIAC